MSICINGWTEPKPRMLAYRSEYYTATGGLLGLSFVPEGTIPEEEGVTFIRAPHLDEPEQK